MPQLDLCTVFVVGTLTGLTLQEGNGAKGSKTFSKGHHISLPQKVTESALNPSWAVPTSMLSETW